MKKQILFNIGASVAVLLGASSCASDYLDLEPQGTPTYGQALGNAQGADLAIKGLCQSMYKQYSALGDYNWFNGEPWLSVFYGDVMGADYISLFWILSGREAVDWTMMYQGGFGSVCAWAYCYNLISQANNVITFAPKLMEDGQEVLVNGTAVPDFGQGEEFDASYAFRYAQALTFRAHAYTRLMQIYAPRWENRTKRDGTEWKTVPLRLKYETPDGNLDCKPSTMEVVMDQIYADLNEALDLYEKCQSFGVTRQFAWEPDLQIAKGIFARAALVKNDYETAEVMAREAREGYPLMTADQYKSGFATPNGEWMWTNSGEATGLYYFSFGASYACNGSYPCLWGNIGAGAISNDLVGLSEALDQRTWLFFCPKNVTGQNLKDRFWQVNSCNENTMDINGDLSQLKEQFLDFAKDRYEKIGMPNGWYPPYTYQGYPFGPEGTICTAQFGAQFKFWGTDGYGTSYFPFMRASEMLLIEAEAAFCKKNKDEAKAMQLLNEINRQRITNYRDKNYTGDQLLEQIKICRRLELWGEGFNWFDFKRWNEPIYRSKWVKGSNTSGNWPITACGENGEFPVNMNHGWRWIIPSTEYNYNHAIDQTEIWDDDEETSIVD